MKAAEVNVKAKSKAGSKAKNAVHSATGEGSAGINLSEAEPEENALAERAMPAEANVKEAPTMQKATLVFSLRDVPGKVEDSAVLSFLSKKEVKWDHIEAIKALAGIDYITISNWLNIDVKTLRKWKSPAYKFKPEDQEKVLLLMILFKHGTDVFGSGERFRQWLYSDNFYFGKRQPSSFLNTGTGIRFVDDNLTAIEYGDNA